MSRIYSEMQMSDLVVTALMIFGILRSGGGDKLRVSNTPTPESFNFVE